MTPKEKANELVDEMHEWFIDYGQAKGCALIAVDEILKLHKKLPLETLEYYVEVKQEIIKL
jgi:hypothetical protein